MLARVAALAPEPEAEHLEQQPKEHEDEQELEETADKSKKGRKANTRSHVAAVARRHRYRAILAAGHRTPDLAAPGQAAVTTQQMGDLVVEALAEQGYS